MVVAGRLTCVSHPRCSFLEERNRLKRIAPEYVSASENNGRLFGVSLLRGLTFKRVQLFYRNQEYDKLIRSNESSTDKKRTHRLPLALPARARP